MVNVMVNVMVIMKKLVLFIPFGVLCIPFPGHYWRQRHKVH